MPGHLARRCTLSRWHDAPVARARSSAEFDAAAGTPSWLSSNSGTVMQQVDFREFISPCRSSHAFACPTLIRRASSGANMLIAVVSSIALGSTVNDSSSDGSHALRRSWPTRRARLAAAPPFHALGVIVQGPLQVHVPSVSNLLELLLAELLVLLLKPLKLVPPAARRCCGRHRRRSLPRRFASAAAAAPSASVARFLCSRPRRTAAPSNLLPVGSAGLAADGAVHARAPNVALVPAVEGVVGAQRLGVAGPSSACRGAGRGTPRRSRTGCAGALLAAGISCIVA